MDFYDCLKQRRSVRSYRMDPIPEASLERLAAAVQCAPSACNRQPWKILIVKNAELRKKICACYTAPFLAEAPAIVVACGNRESCWKRLEGTPSIEIDLGIVMEHLVLAAAAEGLGTCWICAFEKAKLNQAMQLEAPWSVEAISPLGYAGDAPLREVHYKAIAEIFEVIA